MLAICGKGDVARAECAPGAHLRAFLAEHRRPQAEFTLTLERDRLGVDTAAEHHVAVHHEKIAARGGLPVEHSVWAETCEQLVVCGDRGRLWVQQRHVVISFEAAT
jgi:hypothetical protein